MEELKQILLEHFQEPMDGCSWDGAVKAINEFYMIRQKPPVTVEKVIRDMKEQLSFIEGHGEAMDRASFQGEEGVLLTGEKAKFLVMFLEKVKEFMDTVENKINSNVQATH